MLHACLVTAELLLGAAFGSTLIALGFAWGVQRVASWFRMGAIMAMTAAAVLPLYIHASGWEATWGKFGWIPMVQAGISRQWNINGFAATLWIHSVFGAAGASLFLTWVWRYLPRSQYDAARLEVSALKAALRIYFPFLIPFVIASGAWSGLFVATDMTVADLYSIRTLPDVVYQQFLLSDSWLAGSLATLLALGLLGVIFFCINRLRKPLTEWVSELSTLELSSPRQQALAYTLVSLCCLVVCCVPLVGLFLKAGWIGELYDGGVVTHFSFAQSFETFVDSFSRFRQELWWSGMLAGLVTLIALPLAWCAAKWSGDRRLRQGITLCLVGFVAFLPGPMLSLVLVSILSQSWFPAGEFLYSQTLLPTAIATMPRSLAVATGLFALGMYSQPQQMIDLTKLDGLKGFKRWLWIDWPLQKGFYAIAAFAAAYLSVGELAGSLLVAPPDVQTVSVRLFGLLHSGIRRQEAGICLVTVLCEVVLVGCMWLCHDGVQRYRSRHR